MSREDEIIGKSGMLQRGTRSLVCTCNTSECMVRLINGLEIEGKYNRGKRWKARVRSRSTEVVMC